jgi:hypothetical protein
MTLNIHCTIYKPSESLLTQLELDNDAAQSSRTLKFKPVKIQGKSEKLFYLFLIANDHSTVINYGKIEEMENLLSTDNLPENMAAFPSHNNKKFNILKDPRWKLVIKDEKFQTVHSQDDIEKIEEVATQAINFLRGTLSTTIYKPEEPLLLEADFVQNNRTLKFRPVEVQREGEGEKPLYLFFTVQAAYSIVTTLEKKEEAISSLQKETICFSSRNNKRLNIFVDPRWELVIRNEKYQVVYSHGLGKIEEVATQAINYLSKN